MKKPRDDMPIVATRSMLIAAAVLFGGATAHAQTPPPFYAGKEIKILISHPPGGAYDAYARLFGRYLVKHMPGSPAVVAQNMTGAAGVILANYLYNQAPKDGTVLGSGPGSMGTAALFGSNAARYDARRFTWIGSMTAEVSVTGVWHNVPFERAEDLFERELVVGGSGATDISVMYANAANRIFSTRYKTVTGYPGNAAQMVALERGEVQGLAAWNFSSLISGRPHWLPEKKVKILLQLSVDKHPDLAHVPTLLEFARSDAQRTVGNLVFGQSRFARILFAPPGLPADRVEALRTAFETIMADPDFLAEAGKANMEINRPLNGKALAGLIDEFHAAPPELVRQAAEAMGLTVTSPPKN